MPPDKLAEGVTVLDNCAREPEIIDLARLLGKMGAQIDGAGEERMEIQGARSLGGATHQIIPDRIETGTYLIGAAITGGGTSTVLPFTPNPGFGEPLRDLSPGRMLRVGLRVGR